MSRGARLARLRIRLRGADVAVDWLVAGLGNPGSRYEETRHNLGRHVVAELARRAGVRLDASRSHTLFASHTMAGHRVCLAVALKYMNESGPGFAQLASFYKLPPERVVAVYDDIDLPLGLLRLRAGGGAGGHNGIRSLTRALGTEGYPRVRLGVGRPTEGWDASDYVLARVPAEERPALEEAVILAAHAVEAIVSDGIESAMNAFN